MCFFAETAGIVVYLSHVLEMIFDWAVTCECVRQYCCVCFTQEEDLLGPVVRVGYEGFGLFY